MHGQLLCHVNHVQLQVDFRSHAFEQQKINKVVILFELFTSKQTI